MVDKGLRKYKQWLKRNTDLSISSILLYYRTAKEFKEKHGRITIDKLNEFISDKFRNKQNFHAKYALKHWLKYQGKSKWYRQLVKVKVRPRKKRGRYKPDEVILKIVGLIKKEVFRDIGKLQFATGCRAHEIIRLREEMIDFDFEKSARARITQKGSKEGTIFFNRTLAKILRKYLKGSPGFLFLDRSLEDQGEEKLHIATQTMRQTYYRALDKASKELDPEGFATHDFRRNVAEKLRKIYNNDILLVKKTFNHSRIETTMRYFDESKEDVQAAALDHQKIFEDDRLADLKRMKEQKGKQGGGTDA